MNVSTSDSRWTVAFLYSLKEMEVMTPFFFLNRTLSNQGHIVVKHAYILMSDHSKSGGGKLKWKFFYPFYPKI